MKVINYLRGLFKPKPTTINLTVSNNLLHVSDLLTVDVENGVIEIHKPITIRSCENIKIYSDKHVMINTSGTPEDSRPGYDYAIWMNSMIDSNGDPLKSEFFIDNNENLILMEAKYDEEGNLIIPDGYRLPPINNDCDRH